MTTLLYLNRDTISEMCIISRTLHDLKATPGFAAVLLKNIGSPMSGSLSVALVVIGFWLDSTFARSSFFGFAGVCAFIAAYQVWATERRARLHAEAYLQLPDFHIIVHGCYRWTGGGRPFLLVEATVTNHSVTTATVKAFIAF